MAGEEVNAVNEERPSREFADAMKKVRMMTDEFLKDDPSRLKKAQKHLQMFRKEVFGIS